MAEHWQRREVASRAAGAVLAVIFYGLLGVEKAAAQPVYKWTDERGVVHFSDTAPPSGTNYQVRDLPAALPVAAPAEQGADTGAPAAVAAAGGTAGDANGGSPSLEISEQKEAAVGETTHEYRGKVKNVGGGKASGVVVQIRVTDANQGAECVDEEVQVRPSDLGPGETGTYSAEFTNPCYFGPTTASIRPNWD